jgi:3-dehydroquinate dehydratase-1
MICVSISDPSQVKPVLRSGASLIELRLDLLGTGPEELYAGIPEDVRTVVTCRPGSMGDRERSRYLTRAIELGASYVDLELESSAGYSKEIMKAAIHYGCMVIYSYHHFESTPGRTELRRILEKCYDKGGAVAKITTHVNQREDLLNLFSLYDLPGRKIVLGMGVSGRITRVIGPYLGAEFTFASPSAGSETAPGQMSASQLMDIYNVIGVP